MICTPIFPSDTEYLNDTLPNCETQPIGFNTQGVWGKEVWASKDLLEMLLNNIYMILGKESTDGGVGIKF